MITWEELKSILDYDPSTGVFTYKVRRGTRKFPGDEAGSLTLLGYVSIKINRKPYFAHRLAWLYQTGQWPKNQIDHKNRLKTDNRFENLRDVTPAVNQQNHTRAQTGNPTGLRGVTRINSGFKASIKPVGSKQIYLGVYRTPQEAHGAYLLAKSTLHQSVT